MNKIRKIILSLNKIIYPVKVRMQQLLIKCGFDIFILYNISIATILPTMLSIEIQQQLTSNSTTNTIKWICNHAPLHWKKANRFRSIQLSLPIIRFGISPLKLKAKKCANFSLYCILISANFKSDSISQFIMRILMVIFRFDSLHFTWYTIDL